MDRYETCYNYSEVMEHDKWRSRIPEIPMREGWYVKVLPPTMGALCRIRINGYSIYLDCYDILGFVGKPYWEIYDGTDCTRFLLDETEELADFISTLPVMDYK